PPERTLPAGPRPPRRDPGRQRSAGSARERAIRAVLARAVELRGSTIRDYRDAAGEPGTASAEHRVYGRAGLPCVECGRPLVGDAVAQRTTVWCPVCQARTSR
ncbi:MAG: zinc finger domain-containing protein, partial [Planctomycetota bacterium]